MNDQLYFIIRMCKRQDGSVSAPADTRTTLTAALSLFYTRAGQAVASDYLIDTVILMTADGVLVEKASFEHEPVSQ